MTLFDVKNITKQQLQSLIDKTEFENYLSTRTRNFPYNTQLCNVTNINGYYDQDTTHPNFFNIEMYTGGTTVYTEIYGWFDSMSFYDGDVYSARILSTSIDHV